MTGPPLPESLLAEQRRRDALRVAAVAQLAVELVDEVAAVGEDQDAAGARRLDEAERGDRLAGAGGVLEPEALGRRWGPRRRSGTSASDVGPAPRLQSCGSSRLVLLVVVLARDARRPPVRRLVGARRRWPFPLPLRCASARSAVSVPDSASTWWAESSVPSTRCGSSSESRRSRPSSSEQLAPPLAAMALSTPLSSSASAASSARRRGVPGASALVASSPSSTKGSRVNVFARASARRLSERTRPQPLTWCQPSKASDS